MAFLPARGLLNAFLRDCGNSERSEKPQIVADRCAGLCGKTYDLLKVKCPNASGLSSEACGIF
jgi:hypothetical protein